MLDLLSKYLTGNISPEEKQTLFRGLKEDSCYRKEAADMQNLSALISMAEEDRMASDVQYSSFVSLRDFSYGMVRLEIRAQKSGIHLGYKKRDYYEINSAALKFVYK